ncbi:hypothetical protein M378DRAFT_6045 [Amanita muscaria Koide BX008]|uniref:Uncharacterized protein n=1 Tax=Amanita muscaria (strain Koide BX008) TaxID=946122 RepID=A0A0C2XNQ5_AMAMK|nr:hypothetical protein M378DRAFT_6045 [Amanita muscaria Koide BX008]
MLTASTSPPEGSAELGPIFNILVQYYPLREKESEEDSRTATRHDESVQRDLSFHKTPRVNGRDWRGDDQG